MMLTFAPMGLPLELLRRVSTTQVLKAVLLLMVLALRETSSFPAAVWMASPHTQRSSICGVTTFILGVAQAGEHKLCLHHRQT